MVLMIISATHIWVLAGTMDWTLFSFSELSEHFQHVFLWKASNLCSPLPLRCVTVNDTWVMGLIRRLIIKM